MSISLAIGLGVNMGGGPGFTPALLFAGGKQGVWYDPSDFGTMFQDSAGTTPAAVGQPVGLMLDKSQGLAVGSEIVNVGPTPYTANGTVSVLGDVVTATCTVSGVYGIRFPSTGNRAANAGSYQLLFDLLTNTSGGAIRGYANVTTSSGVVFPGGTGNLRGIDVCTSATPGDQAIIRTGTAGESFSVQLTSVSVKSIPGNHATQGTSANRPTLQVDGAGRYYLAFNGTNSCLATASVNFTGTSQMSVFVGLRKLTDISSQGVYESSAAADSNPGNFYLRAPSGGAANYQTLMEGSTANNSVTPSVTAPDTSVLTNLMDLSTSVQILRRNGVQVGSASSPTGGGNFSNAPLNVGARNVSGSPLLFFNGNLYGLCIVGKTASASEIAANEAWMNGKTGAY